MLLCHFSIEKSLSCETQAAQDIRDTCQERVNSAARAGLAGRVPAESGETVFCVRALRGSEH